MAYRVVVAAVLCLVLSFGIFTSAQASSIDLLGPQSNLFRSALKQTGLSPDQVRISFDDLKFFGGDKYRLPYLDVYFSDPFKISPYIRTSTAGNLALSDKFASILMGCANRTAKPGGYNPDAVKPITDRIAKLKDKALATALSELTGRPIETYITADYKKLPEMLQKNVALFLFTVPDVLKYRQYGMVEPMLAQKLDPHAVVKNILDLNVYGTNPASELESVVLVENLLDNIDFPLFNTGANLLTMTTQNMRDELIKPYAALNNADYNYKVETPLGWIVLSNSKNDVYPSDNYLLIIDTRGDDKYSTAGGTGDFAHPISVCLDLAGNDRYENHREYSPAFGAGIFGYGILLDQAGNDVYDADTLALGCGIFGAGVLQDVTGNDKYNSLSYSQASAAFGTATLIDLAGDDTYDIYNYGQGFAYTAAGSILVDKSGDDIYTANDTDIKFPGPQTDKHNTSFAQGVGFGRRADMSDGHSWAGGVGVLVDGEGDDKYTTGTFGQGVGYWYAVGILADKSGNDFHSVPWYGMGAAPHFALGVMQDDAGDDRYVGYMSQTLGQGRDLSLGWFEDSAGNDLYVGANRTLGSGDINGIGVFWDKAGDDVYLGCGDMFGQSAVEGQGTVRDYMLTLGLFVDGSGKDRYLALPAGTYKNADEIFNLPAFKTLSFPALDFAGDGKSWLRPQTGPIVVGAHGAGIDGD